MAGKITKSTKLTFPLAPEATALIESTLNIEESVMVMGITLYVYPAVEYDGSLSVTVTLLSPLLRRR